MTLDLYGHWYPAPEDDQAAIRSRGWSGDIATNRVKEAASGRPFCVVPACVRHREAGG
jgi:hypothetical protein